MDTKIDLGQGTFVDLGKLIATRALVCANSGGGKSWLIRRIVEGAIATVPTIILDREGEFATLREKFDVVLVGAGGEVACAVATAAKLARRLIELRVSAVIDLSDLAMAEKRRFVRLFLEALIALPRTLWGPTLIVIDEAHQFAPESGREAESLAAVVALMDQGRKRGFGTILATQRLAKLHKDAAAEANNLFVGRFAQDVDLKRAGELLGFAGREHRDEIRTSAPGAFFAIGPALEQPGVQRFQAGKVRTTHPDPQHRHAVKPPQPSRKILAVAGELADLKQQVEAEANELDALRAKVREQAATIAKLGRANGHAGPTKDEIDQMVMDAEERAYIRGRSMALARAKDSIESLAGAIQLEDMTSERLRLPRHPVATPPTPSRPQQAAKVVRGPSDSASAMPRGAATKVMTALVQHGPLLRADIGVLTCMVASAGSFGNVLSDLHGRGWIDKRADGKWEATSAGVAALGDYTPLPTGRALIDEWRKKMQGGATSAIYDELVARGDRGATRAELGEATGHRADAGSYGNCITNIRKREILDDVGHGSGKRMRLCDTLQEHIR